VASSPATRRRIDSVATITTDVSIRVPRSGLIGFPRADVAVAFDDDDDDDSDAASPCTIQLPLREFDLEFHHLAAAGCAFSPTISRISTSRSGESRRRKARRKGGLFIIPLRTLSFPLGGKENTGADTTIQSGER